MVGTRGRKYLRRKDYGRRKDLVLRGWDRCLGRDTTGQTGAGTGSYSTKGGVERPT